MRRHQERIRTTRSQAEYRDTRYYYDDHWTGDCGSVGSGRDPGGSVESGAVLYSPSGEIVFCSRMKKVGFK